MFPSTTVPSSADELRDWKRKWGDALAKTQEQDFVQEFERLFKNRRAARGELNPKDFKYMTELYGLRTPARLVGYPVLWKLIEELVGETSKDTLDFSVESVDEDIITAKLEKRVAMATEMLTRPIRSMFKNVSSSLDLMDSGLTEDEIPDSIQAFQEMDFKDHAEVGMMWAMRYLQLNHNFDLIFTDGMREAAITAREFYCVSPENGDPIPRLVNPSRVSYGTYEGMQWLHQAPWLREWVEIPINGVIDQFRHVANETTVAKWERWLQSPTDYNTTGQDGWGPYGRFDEAAQTLYLRVVYYRWKAVNFLYVKESENKFDPERPFIKVVDDPKKTDYRKPYNEVWQGVYIADDHLDVRPKPNQVRENDDYAKTHLDYFGCVKNHLSIVDITINLYIFFCIVMYHIEAMMNRAGGKAIVYDVAQKPKNMPLSDVFYHGKESGMIIINSSSEGAMLGRGFNQFQAVDFTLSDSISQLFQLKGVIEETMHSMTGISRNRTGEGHYEETNKNNAQKIIQSNYITQALFDNHFKVVEDVLNECMNLIRITWNSGNDRILKVFGERGIETFKFLNDWLGPHYGLFVKNSHKERQKKETIMSFAERALSTKQLGILDAVKMVNQSNSKEMERVFEKGLRVMQKQSQEAAKAEQQMKMQEFNLKREEIQSRIKAARIEAEAYIQTERLKQLSAQNMSSEQGQQLIKQSIVDAQRDMDKIMLETEMKKAEEEAKAAQPQPQEASTETTS